jgi:hypothetical protein
MKDKHKKIGRPKKPEELYKKTYCIRLEPALREKVKKIGADRLREIIANEPL